MNKASENEQKNMDQFAGMKKWPNRGLTGVWQKTYKVRRRWREKSFLSSPVFYATAMTEDTTSISIRSLCLSISFSFIVIAFSL